MNDLMSQLKKDANDSYYGLDLLERFLCGDINAEELEKLTIGMSDNIASKIIEVKDATQSNISLQTA